MKRAKRLLAVWLAVALTMCGCWAEAARNAYRQLAKAAWAPCSRIIDRKSVV